MRPRRNCHGHAIQANGLRHAWKRRTEWKDLTAHNLLPLNRPRCRLRHQWRRRLPARSLASLFHSIRQKASECDVCPLSICDTMNKTYQSGIFPGRRGIAVAERTFTAYIEFDEETQLFVGVVPGITGAHTQGATLDELRGNLKEVLELCLEEQGANAFIAMRMGAQRLFLITLGAIFHAHLFKRYSKKSAFHQMSSRMYSIAYKCVCKHTLEMFGRTNRRTQAQPPSSTLRSLGESS